MIRAELSLARWSSCALAVLVVLLGSSSALHATDADANSKSRGSVYLLAAPATDEVRAFETALRESLQSVGLNLVSSLTDVIAVDQVIALGQPRPRGTPLDVIARVLLQLTAHEAILFLTDEQHQRVFVRHIDLQRGFDAVAREGALFVVEGSVEEILSGQLIGISQEEYRRGLGTVAPAPAISAPHVAPAKRSDNRLRLVLAAGYEASALGGGAYQHGPKAELHAWLSRWRIGARLNLAVPMDVGDGSAGARLMTIGGRISGALTLLSRGPLCLMGVAASGFDVTRVQASVGASTLQPKPAFWAANPSAEGLLEAVWSFGRLSLALAAGVDFHPVTERYVVAEPTGSRAVFVSRQLRPVAGLAFGVRL